MVGDGHGVTLRLGLHGLEEIADALGVGDGGGDFLRSIAENELIKDNLINPVGQPDDLVADAAWVEVYGFFHGIIC